MDPFDAWQEMQDEERKSSSSKKGGQPNLRQRASSGFDSAKKFVAPKYDKYGKPVVEATKRGLGGAYNMAKPVVKGTGAGTVELVKSAGRTAGKIPGAAGGLVAGAGLGYAAGVDEAVAEGYRAANASDENRQRMMRERGLTPSDANSPVAKDFLDTTADAAAIGLTSIGSKPVEYSSKIARGLQTREGNPLGFLNQDLVAKLGRDPRSDILRDVDYLLSVGVPEHIIKTGDPGRAAQYLFNKGIYKSVNSVDEALGSAFDYAGGKGTWQGIKQNFMNYSDPTKTLPDRTPYDPNTDRFLGKGGTIEKGNQIMTGEMAARDLAAGDVKAARGTRGFYGQYSPEAGVAPLGVRGLSQQPRFTQDVDGNIIVDDDYGLGQQNVTVTPDAAGIRGAYKIQGAQGTEYTDQPGSGVQRQLSIAMDKADVKALDKRGLAEMSAGKIERLNPTEKAKYNKAVREDLRDRMKLVGEQMALEEKQSNRKFSKYEKMYSMVDKLGGKEMAAKYAPVLAELKDADPIYAASIPVVDDMTKQLDQFTATPTFGEWFGELFTTDPSGKFSANMDSRTQAKTILDIYDAFLKEGASGELKVGGRTLTMSDIEDDPQMKAALANLSRGMNISSVRNMIAAMGSNKPLSGK